MSNARYAALTAAGQPIPALVPLRALVDTGASCTCVDPALISALGITPTGSIQVHTPSTGATPHTASQYDVSLVIPGATAGTPPYVLHTIAVTEAALATQGIDALIGRDVLDGCVLTYNGTIKLFTLAF